MNPQPLKQLDTITERAIDWLVHSGIQNTNGGPDLYGSFNAWYEQDRRIYPFVYSEITGYMVTLMTYLWKRTSNARYLHSAMIAGDWLLNTTYEPNGGFRCLYPAHPSQFDFKKSQMYAFDNGVIVNGLINLYRAVKHEKYLASSVTAADWLVYAAQKPNGAFFPIYQLDEDKFFESDKEWSMCSGSYHAKIAIGLLNLYDLTQKQKYLESAVKVCDFALACQEESGRFVSFLSRGGTNAHPHCYTAEGLWVAGEYLEREDYLDASCRGVKWLLDLQSAEGYIPRLYLDGQRVYHERIDAMSQTLRLALLHLAARRLPDVYREKIDLLVAIIPQFQAQDEDVRVDGGFYFGKASRGQVIPHLNVWVTSFALQALQLYADSRADKLTLNPFFLV